MKASRLTFRVHALRRMFRRRITTDQVGAILTSGEIIENYPDDTPYPSQLILGWIGKRPLHVVAAFDAQDDEAIIITAYEPDPAQWDNEFRRRRT